MLEQDMRWIMIVFYYQHLNKGYEISKTWVLRKRKKSCILLVATNWTMQDRICFA